MGLKNRSSKLVSFNNSFELMSPPRVKTKQCNELDGWICDGAYSSLLIEEHNVRLCALHFPMRARSLFYFFPLAILVTIPNTRARSSLSRQLKLSAAPHKKIAQVRDFLADREPSPVGGRLIQWRCDRVWSPALARTIRCHSIDSKEFKWLANLARPSCRQQSWLVALLYLV